MAAPIVGAAAAAAARAAAKKGDRGVSKKGGKTCRCYC
jgi:hypothetical protein